MDLKNKTRQELEDRIRNMERAIEEKGIGSGYLSRAKRVQRDINLGLILGGVTALLGVTAWTLLRDSEE